MSTPTTSDGPIRIGFVGLSSTGWAASALAPSLLEPEVRKHFKLVAVSTTNPQSAAASAAHYSKVFGHQVKAYHGDATHIASDPEVDFVAISVKAPCHKEVVEKVIAAGKPFFLEWQAGRGVEETREIARLAKEKGVKSLIGLQGKQSNAVKKIKRIVESGELGTLLSVNANLLLPREMKVIAPFTLQKYDYLSDKANKVSLISSAFAHFLDIFEEVLGPLARVSASGTIRYPTVTILDDVTGEPTGRTLQSEFPDHITINGVLKKTGAWVSVLLRLGQRTIPGRTSFEWKFDGEDGTLKVGDNRLLGVNISAHDPEHIYLNGEKLQWNVEKDGEAYENVIPFLKSMWLEYLRGKEGGGEFLDIDDAVRRKEVLHTIETSLFEGGRWIDIV